MRFKVLMVLFLMMPQGVRSQATRPQFMKSGVVEHHGLTAAVTANHPRPLHQAIQAVREEYGWVVDFEDPPYSSRFDLVDDTDPQWRANHPGAKGVWRVAGGSFRSEYPEAATTVPSSLQVEAVLRKIVSDYNAGNNPGKFTVRKESNNRYSIVGISMKADDGRDKEVRSVLDTPLSLPTQRRTAVETVYSILNILSATNGIKVLPLMVPTNALQQSVTVGGANITARELLKETLARANSRRTLFWDLFFDPDPNTNAYLLNIEVATRATLTDSGQQVTRPIPHVE